MPLPPPRVPRLLMRVWDAPTRLFHGAVILVIICSYVTSRLGRMELHVLFGYALLTLLLFRLAWGFVGSHTARFGRYLKSPMAGLRRLAPGAPDAEIGHNAAGGPLVLAMLLALGVEVGTGLFSNAGGVAYALLARSVSAATGDWLSHAHAITFDVLLGLVALHVLMILAYAATKRHGLVRLMVTGKKRLPAATRQPRLASPVLAALVLAIAAGLVWVLVRFA